MIEVYGYLTAVEALDSALKAANVNHLSTTLVQGGLVTVIVTGDVGAVKAAMDASAAAAARVGRVVSVHVIPRPAADTEQMLAPKKPEAPVPPVPPAPVEQPEQPPEPAAEPEIEKPEDQPLSQDTPAEKAAVPEAGSGAKAKRPARYTREKMDAMKVVQLRAIARELKLPSMSKRDIRFANKQDLIQKICEFQDGRDQ